MIRRLAQAVVALLGAAVLTACSSVTDGQAAPDSSSCIGSGCSSTRAAPAATYENPASRIVTVPDLAGLDGNEASAALHAAGVLGTEFTRNYAPMTNKVTGQSPPAGTLQRATATVYVALLGPDGRTWPAGPSTAAAAADPAPPVAAALSTSFDAGTYEVGTGNGQIPPGKYKSPGPDGSISGMCYYARLRSNDGSVNDIIANDISQGPSVLTVKASDGYIKISGCAFTKA